MLNLPNDVKDMYKNSSIEKGWGQFGSFFFNFLLLPRKGFYKRKLWKTHFFLTQTI